MMLDSIVGVLRKDVEQVLSLVILLLYDRVVCSLLDQCQEELEFDLVQGVLHGEHVVVAIIKDKVCNTLLTSLDGDSEGRLGRSLWFDIT